MRRDLLPYHDLPGNEREADTEYFIIVGLDQVKAPRSKFQIGCRKPYAKCFILDTRTWTVVWWEQIQRGYRAPFNGIAASLLDAEII